jgi:hypothetical protein
MTHPTEFELLAGRRRQRKLHLFTNARLNWVGWSALVAASLVSGAFGALVAALLDVPPWVGAALGLPLVVIGLLVADRRRTWLGSIQFGWTESLAEVQTAADTVRSRGVEAAVDEGDCPSLTFRRRDQRTVAAVLGLPTGRYPWQG